MFWVVLCCVVLCCVVGRWWVHVGVFDFAGDTALVVFLLVGGLVCAVVFSVVCWVFPLGVC